jgi:hypothetical protein
MSRKKRVSQLETRIKGREKREPIDWEAFGDIGALTRECLYVFLKSTESGERPEPRMHQLMRVGTFALDNLTGMRPVTTAQREGLRQLMADPNYRGFGSTHEKKHPKALQLFHMCDARGWLD